MSISLPRDSMEFNQLMEEIDTELGTQGIPIHFRQIEAVRRVCMRFEIDLELVSHQIAPEPGNYHGESLSAHIRDWYEARYANRLKINMGPGQTAITLRGDPWKIVFPWLNGSFRIVCDSNIDIDRDHDILSVRQTERQLNPLICIEGLTAEFASSLSDNEMRYIEEIFLLGLTALEVLRKIKEKVFIAEAMADQQAAVSHLFPRTSHFGQSKWASLQFVEKLLKCYLELKAVNYRRTHNLSELASLAENNGLSLLSRQLIDNVQCLADVRYGQIAVTLSEAINAHHASLELCKSIALEIGQL